MSGNGERRRAADGLGVLGRRAGKGLAAFLLAAPAVAGGVYQEKDGLLVVELESLGATGDWVLETAVSGYTGGGYLRWNGPDQFANPGHGTFGAEFEIHQGGTYAFRIRNHHDHEDSTQENDVWVRMDGGPWVKLFSGVKDQWTWASNHEFSNEKPPAEYDLSPGLHKIEFSGRSHDFRMDRFHMYLPGHPKGQDASQPESETSGSNGRPVARIRLSPESIPAGDGGQTIVTLDASESFDPDPGQSLSFRWKVRGAEFVQGTTAKSQIAKVRFAQSGYALPVRLVVRDDDADAPLSDQAVEALNVTDAPGEVHGEPVAWHPMELWLRGPAASEQQSGPNPFLDRRLQVTFTGPTGQRYEVPGFFDGDGHGNGTGDVWKVRFSADEGGMWTWTASFRGGAQVAVSLDPAAGHSMACDGAAGQIVVLDRDPEAGGFLAKGRLEYVGKHYMKFRDGGYFIKGGTDSPENFFGYDGFDDVEDNGGIGIVHRYPSHEMDWRPGDPYFVSSSSGVSSKGIIGALNYLGQEGVNSIYFLPMNLGGDGQETSPFLGYVATDHCRTHYDVSRLHQWCQVMDHAQRQGILLHFVLAETETPNEQWLDSGNLGVQRKLFYRELIARFGHCLAIKWNLSEENDYSIEKLKQFAAYIRAVDPYDHPIAVHTHPNDFSDYPAILGDPHFTSSSIQYDPNYADQFVEEWRQESKAAGLPWIIDMDENGPASTGLTDSNADDLRKRVLYDVLFSGGHVEWYAGYHSLPLGGDVKMEDFRTRQAMWRYMRIARELMEEFLPFWEMSPADGLLSGENSSFGGGQVFAKQAHTYAVYLPNASAGGKLDLTGTGGIYVGQWFDPRSGQFAGTRREHSGSAVASLGLPPDAPQEDWVYLIRRPQQKAK